jgi:hypothetical protein
MAMGNVGAKLRRMQVVDINGRDGTFVMQARYTLPACGQGIAAKSRKVFFSLISFGALLAVSLVAVFRRNAVTKEDVTCIRIRLARG